MIPSRDIYGKTQQRICKYNSFEYYIWSNFLPSFYQILNSYDNKRWYTALRGRSSFTCGHPVGVFFRKWWKFYMSLIFCTDYFAPLKFSMETYFRLKFFIPLFFIEYFHTPYFNLNFHSLYFNLNFHTPYFQLNIHILLFHISL